MSVPTLNDLFFSEASGDGLGASGQSILEQGSESFVALKGELEQQLPKLSYKAVEKELATKIGEVLDVGLDELLVAGWKKYEEFQAYADPAKHPPTETILVPLAKHTIASTHNPRVDLMIKDVLIGSISLNVRLSLALEGIVLKIQAGMIRDVRAGTCRAAGSLEVTLTSKVAQKELLKLQRETPELELGGAIRFGEGVPIPRLDLPGVA